MAKAGSIITALLAILVLLVAVCIFEEQRVNSLPPFQEYLKFNKYARDIGDLNYYLHGALTFSNLERKEEIDKDLNGTDISLVTISEYYKERIKNSLNHQDSEDLMKSEILEKLFNEYELDSANQLFNPLHYNLTTQHFHQLILSPKIVDSSSTATVNVMKADEHFMKKFESKQSQDSLCLLIFILLIVSSIFILVFNCFFVPNTSIEYKKRNKKSRRVETRMSKQTHIIHLTLHGCVILAMIFFISMFGYQVSQFYEKIQQVDFLKIVKDYYQQIRLSQIVDLKETSEKRMEQKSLEIPHNGESNETKKDQNDQEKEEDKQQDKIPGKDETNSQNDDNKEEDNSSQQNDDTKSQNEEKDNSNQQNDDTTAKPSNEEKEDKSQNEEKEGDNSNMQNDDTSKSTNEGIEEEQQNENTKSQNAEEGNISDTNQQNSTNNSNNTNQTTDTSQQEENEQTINNNSNENEKEKEGTNDQPNDIKDPKVNENNQNQNTDGSLNSNEDENRSNAVDPKNSEPSQEQQDGAKRILDNKKPNKNQQKNNQSSSNYPKTLNPPTREPTNTFIGASKGIRNINQFKILFEEVNEQYFKYKFNIQCDLEVIKVNSQAVALCNKNQNNKQKLELGYLFKSVQSHPNLSFYELFEDQTVQDLFQIQFCHDLIRIIEESMEEYIAEIGDQIMVFLFQFGVCLGLLFVFWIPFFNDSTKAKRDAKKFEMVSQI